MRYGLEVLRREVAPITKVLIYETSLEEAFAAPKKSGLSDGQRVGSNGVPLRARRFVPKQPGYGIETSQVAFFLPVFPPPFVFPKTAMIPQPPLLDAVLFDSTYPEELMWIPFAP